MTCGYSARRNNQTIDINESIVIDKYEWDRNGSILSNNGKDLILNGINQQQNSGTYKCKISLKNGQTAESDSFVVNVTENFNQPSIINAISINENQIYIKWEPNRKTTINTRYKIEVINKEGSFEYPGYFYYFNFK